MKCRRRFLLYCLFRVSSAARWAADNESGYDADPYLKYRPNFARSMPVQILLTGIVLTLVSVLFIHLLFTGPYHWPLAPVNYALQLSGVTVLLTSLIATLDVVLTASWKESESWPYMLSYIAVNVPPGDDPDEEVRSNGWNKVQKVSWVVMSAILNGLLELTQIHQLTLLYPSRLERRLIYYLLGSLAAISAVLEMLDIAGCKDDPIFVYATSIRHICNAALSFLFTSAVILWGFVIMKRRAWRTDGGTAAYGVGAVSLAILSTVLTFLYVPRQEEYLWLPSLICAVILWQNFFGWWWWVGADVHYASRDRKKKQSRHRFPMAFGPSALAKWHWSLWKMSARRSTQTSSWTASGGSTVESSLDSTPP